MSSFEKTRHFPTLSCTNKMKSQARFRLRAVSSEKLDCTLPSLHCKLGSVRSERSFRRKHIIT